jgi:hypothetical protein
MNSGDAILYLKSKMRLYEERIAELTAQIDALHVEADRTAALLNSAQILLRDEMDKMKSTSRAKITTRPLSERLALLSFSEAIAEIINSSGRPIHADQILRRLREAGKVSKAKNPKNSVVSLLHRGVKSGLYSKVGPNLFAPIRERTKEGEP